MAKGYRILARRTKTHVGEIDLIAVRGARVVFVEVKARRSIAECEAAITPALGERVRRAAVLWLGRHPRYQQHEQGYDLVFVCPWRLPLHILNAL
jgi:putative endonuclease